MQIWYLIPFMLTPTDEWVLAPENEGWKQEPQNGGYEECILRRDYLNTMLESFTETKGKFKLKCDIKMIGLISL